MKVLFVCVQNVGRSQMAAAFYNQLTGSSDADSAGTNVLPPGSTIGERAQAIGAADKLIAVMDEEGIDMRPKVRTQLNQDMLGKYDLVINMAEKEKTPLYLENHPSVVSWEIEDPRDKSEIGLKLVRDNIHQRVQELISNYT
jgi:arsenate reductase (thioredoxin)